jgi:hypothetical protein
MSGDFLANRSPSWVSWLGQQIIAGIDPNDAMLVNTFVPDLNEVLPPHLIEPVLVPVVYKHDQVYGRPEPGGSSFQSRSASSDLEGLNMDVDQDTAESSSLDSMEQGTLPEDDFNEAIKDEELKVEDLGEPHEAREDEDLKVEQLGEPHEFREGGHGLFVDADQGRIVVPTWRGCTLYALFCPRQYSKPVYDQRACDGGQVSLVDSRYIVSITV